MLNYALMPLKNYAGFTGRSGRAEFWWYTLAIFIVQIVAQSIDTMVMGGEMGGLGFISGAISLLTFIPGLAVGFRRLHDTDRSAWWLLIGLVPLVGIIVLIVFWASAGTAGPNKFGNAAATPGGATG